MANDNEPKRIIPLTDFGFKRMFGTEQNKDLLMDYLNCCIGKTEGIITDIQYLPQEQLGEFPNEKRMIFDIHCANQNKEHFLLEMQKGWQDYFIRRTIAYVCRTVSSKIHKGNRTYNFPKVVSYNLLDFNAPEFAFSDNYFWHIRLKNQFDENFLDFFSIYYMELRKFAAQIRNGKPMDRMQQWNYILNNMQKASMEELPIRDELFEKAFDVCNYQKLNTMEKLEYEKSVLDYEDVKYAIECNSRYAFNKGVAEGEARGKAEGKAEERLAMAKAMLLKGLDLDMISSITELSAEEIKKA